MIIELDERARRNFNERAKEIFNSFGYLPEEMYTKSNRPFNPDIYSKNIKEKDIIGGVGGMKSTWQDSLTGEEIATAIGWSDKGYIGIYGEAFKEYVKLCIEMQKVKELRDKVSVIFIRECMFDWLNFRFETKIPDSMINYFLAHCEKNIEELEIWIPVCMLCVQDEIRLGKVIIKPITKDIVRIWQKDIISSSDPPEIKIRKQVSLDQERVDFQGFSVAIFKVTAESQRAFEIAYKEADIVVSLMRIFSADIMLPHQISYTTLYGVKPRRSITYYIKNKEESFFKVDKLLDIGVRPFSLSKEDMVYLSERGFNKLHDLLVQDEKSEFQKQVLESLLLYSMSSLEHDMEDRVIYIFVALESMLLKDVNEPISNNIAERLAIVTGKDIDEKKLIIKALKRLYSLRSSFVHRGDEISEIDDIRSILYFIWKYFFNLILISDKYQTKHDYINNIDDYKLR